MTTTPFEPGSDPGIIGIDPDDIPNPVAPGEEDPDPADASDPRPS